MPHPSKVTFEQLLAEARVLLEREGIEGLSMRAVARSLGVAAPSLYFHVESREDLLRLLTESGLLQLGTALASATAAAGDASERLHLLADAYAEFGFAHPQLFGLLFGPCPDDRLVDPKVAQAASAPLLAAVAELVPAERVLAISQALWSLAHGYTTLALSDQFRLGGEPRQSMHEGIGLLLRGLLAEPASAR